MRSYPLKPTVPLPTTTDVGTGDEPGSRGASFGLLLFIKIERVGGWQEVAQGISRQFRSIFVANKKMREPLPLQSTCVGC